MPVSCSFSHPLSDLLVWRERKRESKSSRDTDEGRVEEQELGLSVKGQNDIRGQLLCFNSFSLVFDSSPNTFKFRFDRLQISMTLSCCEVIQNK